MEELKQQKKEIMLKQNFYDEIDSNPNFECFSVPEDRSTMNVSFY
jgi:phosphoserine aminotransferase